MSATKRAAAAAPSCAPRELRDHGSRALTRRREVTALSSRWPGLIVWGGCQRHSPRPPRSESFRGFAAPFRQAPSSWAARLAESRPSHPGACETAGSRAAAPRRTYYMAEVRHTSRAAAGGWYAGRRGRSRSCTLRVANL